MHIYESVGEVAEEARNSGFDLEYVQLGKGKYGGTFPTQVHGRSIFIDEGHPVEISVCGTMDIDTCMVASSHDQLIFNGRSNQASELVIYPPGSEIHVVSRGSVQAPQLCMPAAIVDSFLDAADPDRVKKRVSTPVLIPVSPEVTSWFDSSVRMLARTEFPDDGLAQNLEHNVLAYMAGIDESNLGEGEHRGRGRPVEYYVHTFRRAHEYIHANLRTRLALDELCRASDISLRTLQRVFLKRVGVSPRTYILRCKLEAVRRELLCCSPHEQTISAVAQSYGLTHMGRFSAAYFDLFSEYPRGTLARQSTAGR